ncbi:MAG: hypothetical protein RLZZ293_159 [Pseudomonadota bacterium]
MKNLPIGISVLSKMSQNNYIYVDKTHHIANLANSGEFYFLSRPRRFGKSLLIDTLKQAFSANKKLFTGLYLENNWDWSVSYPIIHFDFGGSSSVNSEQVLLDMILSKLRYIAKTYQIQLQENYQIGQILENLIWDLYDKYQQKVVLLVDEYDKPILDCITDTQQAVKMREMLKQLYSVIKANDTYLKFVFLTGVTKFSKVSLFSGLNNLERQN